MNANYAELEVVLSTEVSDEYLESTVANASRSSTLQWNFNGCMG